MEEIRIPPPANLDEKVEYVNVESKSVYRGTVNEQG